MVGSGSELEACHGAEARRRPDTLDNFCCCTGLGLFDSGVSTE